MKSSAIPGKKLTLDELQSIRGGTYPVASCTRKCTTERTGSTNPNGHTHVNYVVQHHTCEDALCFPFDIDRGCSCESYVFD